MKLWATKRIAELCEERDERAGHRDLRIYSVSKNYGIIPQSERFKKRIASSSIARYKVLYPGDFAYDPMLLWSGSISRHVRNEIGVVSPAYCVFRLKENLNPVFLHRYLRHPDRLGFYDSVSFGTNERRRKARFLDFSQLDVPVPPMTEQKRLVSLMDEADEIQKLRAQSDHRTRDLISAIFFEMFGDSVVNQKKWELSSFSTVGTLDRGRSKHRPRDDLSLYGGEYPFIQTGDVAGSNGVITSYTQTYSGKGLAQSKLWPANTLVITIAANIGKTAILAFPACFPDSMVGFIPGDRVLVQYVRQWLVTLEKRIAEAAPQMAQKNINLQILNDLVIPVPPLTLQREFARRVAEIHELHAVQSESRARAGALFRSVLHSAFSGKL